MDWKPVKPDSLERLISKYEYLVAQAEQGYDMCIYEYTNDLACRIEIQERLEADSALDKTLLSRLERADTKLRAVLVPTNNSIYGDYLQSHFWFYGIPQDSPELMKDAKELGVLS